VSDTVAAGRGLLGLASTRGSARFAAFGSGDEATARRSSAGDCLAFAWLVELLDDAATTGAAAFG
jgi:hypothetical protein